MTLALLAQPQHRPVRSQYRATRRARPTGCTVLHSAESVLDTIGPDTGAENVAAFIAFRRDPGSYHDLVDSDTGVHLVPYEAEAYQDGTGSNPWAMSLSWALAAKDWPRLSPARRDGFLEQGALRFRAQQAWLVGHGYPATPLRRITRAQSEAKVAGFVTHGDRDPGRRSDPGTSFPWSRWFAVLGAVQLPPPPAPPAPPEPARPVQEDDMLTVRNTGGGGKVVAIGGGVPPRHIGAETWSAYGAAGVPHRDLNDREFDLLLADLGSSIRSPKTEQGGTP